MPPLETEPTNIVAGERRLTALWTHASAPVAVCALAHGAGAGMAHPFLHGVADGLAASGISVLRFNFPYMEAKRRVPDGTAVILEAWGAALSHVVLRARGLPVVAAGKSFGGRMASVLAARQGDEFPGRGLVFFGYPLHPPGRIDRLRDAHLPQVRRPMLFIQGTRDALARRDLVEATVQRLGARAHLHFVDGADHSFHVAGVKRNDRDAGADVARVAVSFVRDSLFA